MDNEITLQVRDNLTQRHYLMHSLGNRMATTMMANSVAGYC